MRTSNIIFGKQMISNEKVANNKDVEIINIYNLYFNHFSIRHHSNKVVVNMFIIGSSSYFWNLFDMFHSFKKFLSA
jgi:hypothetical protein